MSEEPKGLAASTRRLVLAVMITLALLVGFNLHHGGDTRPHTPTDMPLLPHAMAGELPDGTVMRRIAPTGSKKKRWNNVDDVVMGLARYEDISDSVDYTMRVFVGSLRASGYAGRIVLWVHPHLLRPPVGNTAMRQLNAFMAGHNVDLIATEVQPCDIKFTQDASASSLRKLCTPQYPTLPLEWTRFAFARDWLRGHPEAKWVLLSDIRDAFFQRPPFMDLGYPLDQKVMIFAEYFGRNKDRLTRDGKKLGVDATHWFVGGAAKCYGEDAYKSYAHKEMLCSGQVLGTRDATIGFLDTYVGEMERHSKGERAECFPPVMPDQPLLVHMVHTGALDVDIVPHGEGPVLHLGIPCTFGRRGQLRAALTFDDKGFILDAHGRRAPMLHQYDRCENWMEHWLRWYMADTGEVPLKRGEAPPNMDVALPAAKSSIADHLPNPADPEWELCGREGALCKCSTQIRYGHAESNGWDTLDLDGEDLTLLCKSGSWGGVFYDEAPNRAKECQCKKAA